MKRFFAASAGLLALLAGSIANACDCAAPTVAGYAPATTAYYAPAATTAYYQSSGYAQTPLAGQLTQVTANYSSAIYAPAPVYTPAPVTTYYAPAAVPVTSYYAPAVTPVTTYYAPAATPVSAYYAPVAPVYYGQPAVVRIRYRGW